MKIQFNRTLYIEGSLLPSFLFKTLFPGLFGLSKNFQPRVVCENLKPVLKY